MKNAGEEDNVQKHLDLFEELDFEVFNKQDWEKLGRSHSQDVRVVWPDGHETVGIKEHAEDLSAMFVAIPDYHITSHPVIFGSGEWTCAIGVVEGTFTKPMPVGDGETIQPTNKKLKINMCTVAHWKDGLLDVEYLFWDQASFRQQLGIG